MIPIRSGAYGAGFTTHQFPFRVINLFSAPSVKGKRVLLRVTCTFSVHVSTHTDTKTRVFRRSNRSPTATKTLAVTLDSTFPFRPLLLVDPWRSRISFHPRERYQGNVSTHVKTVRALISGFIQNSLRKIFKSLDGSRIVRIIRSINFLDSRFLNFRWFFSKSFFFKSSSVSLNASLI